jgi:hypothetical protein
MTFQRGMVPPSGPRDDSYSTRSFSAEDPGSCSIESLPDQLPQAAPQLVHDSESYTLPFVWQLAQNVVNPASIAAWFGAVSAPQLGQLGAEEGKKRGVRTSAQTLQVNVGRASDVILAAAVFRSYGLFAYVG